MISRKKNNHVLWRPRVCLQPPCCLAILFAEQAKSAADKNTGNGNGRKKKTTKAVMQAEEEKKANCRRPADSCCTENGGQIKPEVLGNHLENIAGKDQQNIRQYFHAAGRINNRSENLSHSMMP